MLQRRTLLTSACIGAGLALAARMAHAADTVAPTAPPPELAALLPGAKVAGFTRMRFFGFDVYDAALWVGPDFRAGSFDQHPHALELTYLRGLSGRAIAERSLKEMRRGTAANPEQDARWLGAMQNAFPDVNKGDRITGLHTPGSGARFWFNSQARSTIADPEFSRQFFGIWLSPATSEPQLRAALLARATP
ncbi:MAG: hypothetical protein RLZZ573_148 [Pseudomonadota bacterium]